jgi:type IX secretion system PorP/SprF family membrane protein
MIRIITILLCIPIFIESQDIHFSQFYNAPMKLNPANTGAFDGDLRVISNYKNQWASIESPFKTYGFSADLQAFKYKWKNNYLGIGLGVFSDKAGDLGLGSTQTDLSVSSILELNPDLTMSVGIQAVYMQFNMDYSSARTGNQFTGSSYNSNIATGEANLFNPFSIVDIGTGVSWNYAVGENNIASKDMFIINCGFAFFHLNRSELNFINSDRLHPRIVAHGNSNIGLRNSKLSIMPSYLFMLQGHQKQLLLGSLFRLYLREESRYTGVISEASLIVGAHYRVGDAIIPSFAIDFGDYLFQISYDINSSYLTRSTNGRGGFEFTLRYRNPELFALGSASSIKPKFM